MTSRAGRVARAFVRCYPRAWRARYEGEVCALLEVSAPTWRPAGDLARCCVEEWVRLLMSGLLSASVGSAVAGSVIVRVLGSGVRLRFSAPPDWLQGTAVISFYLLGGLVSAAAVWRLRRQRVSRTAAGLPHRRVSALMLLMLLTGIAADAVYRPELTLPGWPALLLRWVPMVPLMTFNFLMSLRLLLTVPPAKTLEPARHRLGAPRNPLGL